MKIVKTRKRLNRKINNFRIKSLENKMNNLYFWHHIIWEHETNAIRGIIINMINKNEYPKDPFYVMVNEFLHNRIDYLQKTKGCNK
jgi:hypothetical protein